MSKAQELPDKKDGQTFEEWVAANREELEAHAETDYPTAKGVAA